MPRKHPLLVALGARIRMFREEHGWSQEKLAELADLDRTYIGGVERGERNISVINLAYIAKALKVTLKDVFEGLKSI